MLNDPVFDEVPLEERLISDIGDFFEIILRQKVLSRQAAAEQMASGSSSDILPPEVRLGAISANRMVEIEFTSSMSLPETE